MAEGGLLGRGCGLIDGIRRAFGRALNSLTSAFGCTFDINVNVIRAIGVTPREEEIGQQSHHDDDRAHDEGKAAVAATIRCGRGCGGGCVVAEEAMMIYILYLDMSEYHMQVKEHEKASEDS